MSETTVDYRVLPDGSLRAEPTPGPWTVVHKDGQLLIRAGTGNLAGIPDPDDEDEANARLIARSPAMRAALERIEALAKDGRGEPGAPPFGIDRLVTALKALREIRDEARAALREQAT